MTPPPPEPLLLTTADSLYTTLSDFLVVAFHTILFERALYPPSTFLLTRAFNFPVRQNRHPKVCRWILDSVAAIEAQMVKGTVKRVIFVIHSRAGEVMERFVFDVERFPVVPDDEQNTEFVRDVDEGEAGQQEFKEVGISAVDVGEQLRAAIRKLAYCGGRLGELPEGCVYTVAVELRDDSDPPIGHPQPWVPSEPSLQTGEKGKSKHMGSDLGGVKSVPVKAVEAGEFILEAWIEEGKAKQTYNTRNFDGSKVVDIPKRTSIKPCSKYVGT